MHNAPWNFLKIWNIDGQRSDYEVESYLQVLRRTCGNVLLYIPWLYQDDLRLWAVLDEFFEALYKRRSSFVKKEAVWAEDDVGGSFQVGSDILVPLQDSTDGFFLKLTVHTQQVKSDTSKKDMIS